ncbi:hypothetical protein INT43_006003 [Umbelopsis isabellina]|uniref:Gag1-like clamp domain-containing protein n=1 Tax=Mortierella isabellina TaxID=91625 RepID=A0A8H7PJ90_MORIS|nr:hypothetical protein INT43_006003 [Umbelopsis isabellina]
MSTENSVTSLDPSVVLSKNESSSDSDPVDIQPSIPDSNTQMDQETVDSTPLENKPLKLWKSRRKAWTTPTENGRKTEFVLPKEFTSKAAMCSIYDSLITDRRKLVKPLSLSAAIQIMVTGWKRDGTWPEGMEAPKDSD